jgi:hypothetical protein
MLRESGGSVFLCLFTRDMDSAMIYVAWVTTDQFQVINLSVGLRVAFQGKPYRIRTTNYMDQAGQNLKVILLPCPDSFIAAPPECQAMIDSIAHWIEA